MKPILTHVQTRSATTFAPDAFEQFKDPAPGQCILAFLLRPCTIGTCTQAKHAAPNVVHAPRSLQSVRQMQQPCQCRSALVGAFGTHMSWTSLWNGGADLGAHAMQAAAAVSRHADCTARVPAAADSDTIEIRQVRASGEEEMSANINWAHCPVLESVPGKVSGAWVFRGTRVPVSAVLKNLKEMSITEVVSEYPSVTVDQVRTVLDFIAHTADCAA